MDRGSSGEELVSTSMNQILDLILDLRLLLRTREFGEEEEGRRESRERKRGEELRRETTVFSIIPTDSVTASIYRTK